MRLNKNVLILLQFYAKFISWPKTFPFQTFELMINCKKWEKIEKKMKKMEKSEKNKN